MGLRIVPRISFDISGVEISSSAAMTLARKSAGTLTDETLILSYESTRSCHSQSHNPYAIK
jgi:hypothetical protein